MNSQQNKVFHSKKKENRIPANGHPSVVNALSEFCDAVVTILTVRTADDASKLLN